MLSVADAIAQLTTGVSAAVGSEEVAAHQCLGRILSADIMAPLDVPPADNSAMDGYAFCYQDAVAENFTLPLSQRVAAGQAPQSLDNLTAARIFTGGEIPSGADTVAIQENCRERDGRVIIDKQIVAGANVRPKGQDIQCGAKVLSVGTLLRPQELGLLASLGIQSLPLYKQLRVAFFSTGDELVEPGNKLQPGQIYDSNRATLNALISSLGMLAVDLGRVPDNPTATLEVLQQASEQADIILSAGGVSVGEEDYVKQALETLGQIDFWKVAIKPGKPIAFGEVQGKPFIGLPGNPASVFVTFMILVRPFLLRSQGCGKITPALHKAKALFSRSGEKREVYLRGRLVEGAVEIHRNQSSGVLSSACWGDALVIQRPNISINRGDAVDIVPFSELGLV